jgi:hypothetical protein
MSLIDIVDDIFRVSTKKAMTKRFPEPQRGEAVHQYIGRARSRGGGANARKRVTFLSFALFRPVKISWQGAIPNKTERIA